MQMTLVLTDDAKAAYLQSRPVRADWEGTEDEWVIESIRLEVENTIVITCSCPPPFDPASIDGWVTVI